MGTCATSTGRTSTVTRDGREFVNPFDRSEVAATYEAWYSGAGRQADRLEKHLLEKLLGGFPNSHKAIDIGCGTGHFSRWLRSKGMAVTGLDTSAAMLAEARRLNGGDYALGDALKLPFPDKAFDLAVMVTTLEFVREPLVALHEAVRVARQGLILGVLNRWSLLALRRRLSRKPPWNCANSFSTWELQRLVHRAAGQRWIKCQWSTAIFPSNCVTVSRFPVGGFIGMTAHLTST